MTEQDWLICLPADYTFLYFVLTRVRPERFNANKFLKLFLNVKIDITKNCWLKGKDWSIYQGDAHRISFELFKEDIKNGYEVCHHCDRKGCINPEHLFQGTHSDNIKDAINKGRIQRLKISDKNFNKNRGIVKISRIIKQNKLSLAEINEILSLTFD